ncbi:MAG: helix-turn-helix transcriptional regulator [Lachnospiraceae bacterium]|nr:helix-turn-helix transcriptional regulator [Lachnospiraceae bacterium]
MKERIKKVRRELELTQQEFADKLGIKRGAIANYEVGRNEPADSVISLICREFNVNEEWLRSGTGEMFKPAPSSALDAMVEEYRLSHGDYILIEKFVHMKAENRAAIVEYITQVAAALAADDVNPATKAASGLFDGIPETPEELEKLYPPVDLDKNKETG